VRTHSKGLIEFEFERREIAEDPANGDLGKILWQMSDSRKKAATSNKDKLLCFLFLIQMSVRYLTLHIFSQIFTQFNLTVKKISDW